MVPIHPDAARTGLPPEMRLYLKCLVGFSFLGATILLFNYFVLKSTWPHWFPFFSPNARFTDFTIFRDRFRYFHQASFFATEGFPSAGYPFSYPAPAAVVLNLFFAAGKWDSRLLLAFNISIFFFGACWLYLALIRRGISKPHSFLFIGLSGLLGYPILFLINRGNIEGVCWLFTASGVWAFWSKRWYLCGILLGAATALKLFPFILLGLLFSQKRYSAFAVAIGIAILITGSSYFFVGPTYHIASTGIAAGLEAFRTNYALTIHWNEIGFDHSLFAIVKLRVHQDYRSWLQGYLLVAAFTGLVLYWLRVRKLPRINQVLCLVVASVILPPVSYEYTLVHLYLPWAAMVLVSFEAWKKGLILPGLRLAAVLLALVTAIDSYFFWHGIRIGGELKCACLVTLFCIGLFFPWPDEGEQALGLSPA
ncbi:glycosyltransferase family 87 protein [Terriglobus saanensis]|uniref:DUF2029 domain-containing protein n=1 Tax=Terriglobus saanensis (strain ATCC BAA-1853 / DSM 23119 / SP1PR4) TaxID=401053 RepID=E8V5S1_TERSS|nr:glycosyltransferase family 87 protein [Terriglobus saanensis]ADV82680.1 hypothetical protein AciPR4_1874 [Terriglobus saanensis SP1PR4]